jgi:U3 small nucleolar ribonucleoprotein protein IMP3
VRNPRINIQNRSNGSRNMEDFVTWVDSSKIKRNIMKYRDKLDDFELEVI